MTRQELQQALKTARENGTVLQVKLTASTEALTAEYDRINSEMQQEFEDSLETQVEDLEPVQLPSCDFEGQPVYDELSNDLLDALYCDIPVGYENSSCVQDYLTPCDGTCNFCPVTEIPVLPEDMEELKEVVTTPMQYSQDFQPTEHGQPLILMLTALVVLGHAIYTLMEPLVTPLVTKYTPSARRVTRRATKFFKEFYKSGVKLIESI